MKIETLSCLINNCAEQYCSGVVSHVGIYTGNGQMIHASSGSRQVRKVKLNQRYWQQRLVGGVTFLGVRPAAMPMASEGWLRPNG